MTGITPKQQLVLDTLTKSDQPLSAYSLLDKLRNEGFKAPPQIYRALEKLVDLGLAHRLDSLNAFIACSQSGHCHDHAISAFVICTNCGQAHEVPATQLAEPVREAISNLEFSLQSTKIELQGLCAACKA